MPFQPGNTEWAKGNPKKPYREALRLELAAHENGLRLPKVRKGSLRYLARQALYRAGNNTAALEHVANRLDGPVIAEKTDQEQQQAIVEIRLVLIQGNESKVIDGAKSSDIKHLTDMTASSQDGKLETQDVVSEAHNEGSE